jgi:uncharacterized protein (DUF2164 family)
MALELTKQETDEAIHSLKKYCADELDLELSDLRAKLLLGYLVQEFGPFAYNRGVQDAERFMRARVEDLTATCFEPPLPYWPAQKKR